MGENLGVWVRYNYTTLRYSSLRGPWKIHEIPLLTGDTIQTASFMRQQRECVPHSPYGCWRWAFRKRLPQGCDGRTGKGAKEHLGSPSLQVSFVLRQSHGDPEPVQVTVLLGVGNQTGQPPKIPLMNISLFPSVYAASANTHKNHRHRWEKAG